MSAHVPLARPSVASPTNMMRRRKGGVGAMGSAEKPFQMRTTFHRQRPQTSASPAKRSSRRARSATIYSAACLLRHSSVLHPAQGHTSGRTTFQGENKKEPLAQKLILVNIDMDSDHIGLASQSNEELLS